MRPCELWKEQCSAVRQIVAEFGAENAPDHLIREKFLSFLEAAETVADFEPEIAAFVDELRAKFGGWQLTESLAAAYRFRATDSGFYDDTGDDPAMFGMARDEDHHQSAADAVLVEQAWAWLQEKDSANEL